MNISEKTRKITIAAILTAITFLLGLTPIGYIPLPAMKITILCVPVIIGVLLEGLGVGLWLGFIFGLTSLIQIFMGDPIGVFLMGISVPRTLIMVFIPRLLVPVIAYYSHGLLLSLKNKITDKATYVISSLIGSLTNTVFFLSFLYLLFIPEIEQLATAFEVSTDGLLAFFVTVVVTNGIPEAIAAMIIVTAVCIPLVSITTVYKDKKDMEVE